MLSAFGNVPTVEAAAPRVRFDVASCVECRDVTTPEFTAASPRERLIEAQFRISMLVTSGREEDLSEVFITVESPEQRLRVVDFFPKNNLESGIDGTIQRQETIDHTNTFDLGLAATAGHTSSPVNLAITPSIGGHWSQKNAVCDTYHKLPPKKLVLASGTTGGGYGVFFKLHPTSQDSMQGAHSYRVVFAAPANWRIDRIVLTCSARGTSKVLFVKQEESSGQIQTTISLYRAGDIAAQQAAQRLAGPQTPAAAISAARASAPASRKSLIFD